MEAERLLVQGRFGNPHVALRELEQYLPELQLSSDPEAWTLGLYTRAYLMRLSGANKVDVVAAWSMLESAAAERHLPVWVGIACAMRARTKLETGDPGSAMGDLARINLDPLVDELSSIAGFRLLDATAAAFARIRLFDRADAAREMLEATIGGHEPLDQATHWATWAAELAARAMEPLARGASEPEPRTLDRAVQLAESVIALGVSPVPEPLRRMANGIRALSAGYRGRPAEALELLGSDAFGEPTGLHAPESQLLVVAALHAHTLVGSHATARSLDESVSRHVGSLPNMVLEVCRARERLWLEREAGGDPARVTDRLVDLLVRLGWLGMELVGNTARQAMEHHTLVTESRTDPLTGVGNRRALDEEMAAMLRFTQLPVAMVLIDLDDFKKVNDIFTHLVGDEVLRQVAISLSDQLGAGDRLVRYGGDEFVVLLAGAGDAEARVAAERMARAIHTLPWDTVAAGLRVRVTTGCAALYALTGRRPAADAQRLFRRADEALLENKRHSRVSLPEPESVMPEAAVHDELTARPVSSGDPAASGDPATSDEPAASDRPAQPTTEVLDLRSSHPTRARHASTDDPGFFDDRGSFDDRASFTDRGPSDDRRSRDDLEDGASGRTCHPTDPDTAEVGPVRRPRRRGSLIDLTNSDLVNSAVTGPAPAGSLNGHSANGHSSNGHGANGFNANGYDSGHGAHGYGSKGFPPGTPRPDDHD